MKSSNIEHIKEIFKSAGMPGTPVRILVYRQLLNSENPLSLTDLESLLESVDKSTISRTLATFKKLHLVHSFNDGSGSVKYEICHSHFSEKDEDKHIHFRCEKCGQTICLNWISVPVVKLPEGYIANEYNYVVSGICAECNQKCVKP